jgi:hypothetical protein
MRRAFPIPTPSGRSRRSASTGSLRHRRSATGPTIRCRSNGMKMASSTCATTRSTGMSRRGAGMRSPSFSNPTTRPEPARKVSYAELQAEVIRMANTLRKMGVAKGDRVTIYMPMVVEGAVAMLACARIGAVHSVVFGGFLARSAGGADRGLREPVRHLRRCGRARRQACAAEGECRRRAGTCVDGVEGGAGRSSMPATRRA